VFVRSDRLIAFGITYGCMKRNSEVSSLSSVVDRPLKEKRKVKGNYRSLCRDASNGLLLASMDTV
jgi:hypothetical protein